MPKIIVEETVGATRLLQQRKKTNPVKGSYTPA
jgi:hypothetical protein